jgi:uncharacterized protein YndB with AHSA1/START domain
MAANDHSLNPSPTADREVVIERVFNAPRELVFQAFTDPEHVDAWWGPKGFTTTTDVRDVRPGGSWTFMMVSAEGVEFENHIDYLEVEVPERLLYDHGTRPGLPPHFRVEVVFKAEGNRTRLTMRSTFPTAEARDYVVREFNAVEGGNQTLDRLERHLAERAA